MKIIVAKPLVKPRIYRRELSLHDRQKGTQLSNYQTYQDILFHEFPKELLEEKVLKISFVLPLARKYSQRKKNRLYGVVHRVRPKIDNLVACFCDCIKPLNPKHEKIIASKVWGEQGMIIIGEHPDEEIHYKSPEVARELLKQWRPKHTYSGKFKDFRERIEEETKAFRVSELQKVLHEEE